MLSRVADSIYWMNRYMERAENYARFINVTFTMALDMPPHMQEDWEPLLLITQDLEGYQQKYGENIEKNKVIRWLAFDADNPNSILNSLYNVRENARTVREAISREMWEQTNRLYLTTKAWDEESIRAMDDASPFTNQIIHGLQLIAGITASTISHGEAWHFGRIGRFLERADQTSRILDVKYHTLLPESGLVGGPVDLIQWVALLKSVSGYSVCRRQYGAITPSNVIDLLTLDAKFPRSIFFCIRAAQRSLHEILADGPRNAHYIEAEKLLATLCTDLQYTSVGDIIAHGLHEYMDKIQLDIIGISNALWETFFALKPVDQVA